MGTEIADIQQSILQARQLLESLERAATLDEAVKAAERQTRSKLNTLLRLAAADAVIADVDPQELLRFAARPHLVRQLGHGKRWEVLVPKMFKLNNVGWPVREEGEYVVYFVSPFVGTIVPISPEIREAIPELEIADFAAHVEDLDLVVDEGDPDDVAQKIGGQKAVVERKGKRLRLKAQARFNVLVDLIRMGVLPWAPNPLPASLLRPPQANIELRDYQQKTFAEFERYGALSLFAFGGTGKMYLGIHAADVIAGPKVIMARYNTTLDQWRYRLELFAPHLLPETTFLTYAALDKTRKSKWSLAILDEVHSIAATTYLEAAYIDTQTRIGMSATPVRLDGREDLIAAVCGPPAGMEWPIQEIAKPEVTIWIVRNEREKLRKLDELAALPRQEGRVFIYCDHIAPGHELAKRLGVPFVYGSTKHPLDVIRDNPVVVLSRVGDMGISFNVERIVQYDYMGRSQVQEGQRALRAGHEADLKSKKAEMHLLATPEEWKRCVRERTLIYRRWGIGVNVQVVGAVSDNDLRGEMYPRVSRAAARAKPRPAPRSSRVVGTAAAAPANDEVEETWALPGIQAKVTETRKLIRPHAWPYVKLLFELCFQAPFSFDELFLLKGIANEATKSRYRTTGRAMLQTGLLTDVGDQRFKVNRVLIDQIRALREASRRA